MSSTILSMNDANEVASQYTLGEVQGPITPVSGGLLHSMYRLVCERGEYAVKVLDPKIMTIPGILDAFRRSEEISAAMLASSIPACSAVSGTDGHVTAIGNHTVIVYPWVTGKTLTAKAAEPRQAYQIGALLGKMHGLNLQRTDFEAPKIQTINVQEWNNIVELAHAKEAGIAANLQRALPHIISWAKISEHAERQLAGKYVISHCDLDQKNVIWKDEENPVIVDWESAGPISPAFELANVALYWSGITMGAANEAAFRAVLAGYCTQADFSPNNALPALQCCLGGWLSWLTANIEKSLGINEESEDQIAVGERETITTLTTLFQIAKGIYEYASWLSYGQ